MKTSGSMRGIPKLRRGGGFRRARTNIFRALPIKDDGAAKTCFNQHRALQQHNSQQERLVRQRPAADLPFDYGAFRLLEESYRNGRAAAELSRL